ncbi:hypothetical protein ACFE04_018603 [Oxalis oulophora]
MEYVNMLVTDRPVVIFSRSTCCMSHTIQALLLGFGANPTIYELDEIPNGTQIERALQQLGCQPNAPAVFIGGQLVGGPNQITTLHLQTRLVPLLKQAGAIWM